MMPEYLLRTTHFKFKFMSKLELQWTLQDSEGFTDCVIHIVIVCNLHFNCSAHQPGRAHPHARGVFCDWKPKHQRHGHGQPVPPAYKGEMLRSSSGTGSP